MALKFRYLLEEMGFAEKRLTPIYVDNEAVKFTAYHETIMEKNRHIKSKYFLVQGHVNTEVSVIWLRGTHNPADMLTKPLPASEHRKHADLLLSGIEQATPPKPSGRGGVPEHNGPGPEYTGSLKPEIHPGEKYPPIHGPYTRAGPPNCQVDQFSPSANRAGQSKHTESGVNCI